MAIDVTLPNNGWTPRPHQKALWQYLRNGGKRAMAVWHRRAGKDEVAASHALRVHRACRKLLALPSGIFTGPQSNLDGGQPAQRQAAHRRGVPDRVSRQHQRP